MSTPRKPRADASRNRDRLLETARILLAENGSRVQLPEIARAAGVGMGTVYRHFPTQADLIEAVAAQRFEEIEEFARTECLTKTPPGQGLDRYLRHVGSLLATDQTLSAAIESARHTAGSEPRGESRTRLEVVIGDVITRDQEAGTVRADCTVPDVYMLVGAISATIRAGSGDWERLLDLTTLGLRPR
ncbi:TetR family transcriptional regulator [Nocardia sp. SYP-A9097]|uniref:TetR/AcrR family transcriptional regulator n=1 Tax=Nocardia sp. SYP-A9097 TaxID=2663237 RepID=UPI00129B48ED|nr:TetR/AcrR family transcriptional regulator [Nocardia sp. SYP-A9097]MRH89167.1 TetR family transcriptional regulator [Nocardia sp. SYP-A9097]